MMERLFSSNSSSITATDRQNERASTSLTTFRSLRHGLMARFLLVALLLLSYCTLVVDAYAWTSNRQSLSFGSITSSSSSSSSLARSRASPLYRIGGSSAAGSTPYTTSPYRSSGRLNHYLLQATTATTELDESSSAASPTASASTGSQSTSSARLLLSLSDHITSMSAHIKESLAADTFLSLTVAGPSKKMIAQQQQQQLHDADDVRGCLRLLTGRLIEAPKKKLKQKKRSTAKNTSNLQQQQQQQPVMMQITLKYHGATDIVKNWELDNVPANLESLLGLSAMMANNASVWTDAASEWGQASLQAQAPGTPLGIQKVTLETVNDMFVLDMGVAGRSKPPQLSQRKSATPTSTATGAAASTAAIATASRILAHDRTKQVPLSNQADFLQKLGVADKAGKPRPGMTSKLRQCQKFVEIVGRLVERCCSSVPVVVGSSTSTSSNTDNHDNNDDSTAPLAAMDREISVVDMGCGRGYLTFSLHSFLQDKYGIGNENNGFKIRSRGIDVRPKLVQEISEIARSLGTPFDALTFEEGTIADFLSAGSDEEGPISSSSLDVLIALHACDTATDDALWSGIARQANVIVVAPCCHKQVRPQLDAHASKNPQHPLADVLRHNIYRERLAETATDSIRALLLEIAGYNVQVFEFIGGEHTSKNVMITAVKQSDDRIQRSEKDLLALRKRVQDLASLHGIREQRLVKWMGETLQENFKDAQPLSARNMPPL